MRWDLLNLPLNSPAGCTRTTGALLQAFNDTVTCIASLYFNTVALHRCFFFSRSSVGCSGIKPSAFQSCDSFFFSSSEVERQEQSGGGGPACFPTGRWCNVFVPFPPCYWLFLARCDIFYSNHSFAMAGAIIENMSTKKLVIVGVILLLFQAFAFMVGGLIGKFSLPLSLTFIMCVANICLCARACPLKFQR